MNYSGLEQDVEQPGVVAERFVSESLLEVEGGQLLEDAVPLREHLVFEIELDILILHAVGVEDLDGGISDFIGQERVEDEQLIVEDVLALVLDDLLKYVQEELLTAFLLDHRGEVADEPSVDLLGEEDLIVAEDFYEQLHLPKVVLEMRDQAL